MPETPRDNKNDRPHEGGEGPPQQQDKPNRDDTVFDPARELGRQLARGMAFSAGKQIYEETARKHFHELIEWIRSLFT